MKAAKKSACLVFITLLILFLAGSLNAAAPDYDFYKGKIITYVVATAPGGGYDTYARLIAKYMQKHIPGSTIVVRNIPGAGHVVGANEIYLAKPDGLTIGTFNPALIYTQIVGLPGMRFDLNKFSWIGKASSEIRVLIVSNKTSFRSFKDLLDSKGPIKMATSGVGGQDYCDTLLIGYALDIDKLKPIPGYGGRQGEMAMLRGEVDGQVGSYNSLVFFIKAEKTPVILQFGSQKHPDLPDVPLASDFKLSPEKQALLRMVVGVNELGRPTAAAPGIPAARMQVLQEAYSKALADQGLLKEAKTMKLDINPSFGKDVGKRMLEVSDQPETNIALLKKLIKVE